MFMSRKINICACDDENKIKIESIIKNYFNKIEIDYTMYFFNNPEEVFRYNRKNPGEQDLIIIDIEQESMLGIEVNGSDDEYGSDHCYYILKRELEKRLPEVLSKIIRNKQERQIVIDSYYAKEIVEKNKILYIERSMRTTYIYTEEGRIIETKRKVEEILEILESLDFVRCHNSYIVALPKVIQYKRQELTIKNGRVIPISRKYAEGVKDAFARWQMTIN